MFKFRNSEINVTNNATQEEYEVDEFDVMPIKSSRKGRRLDDKKSMPFKPGTSCYRKGYHKYEKDWKKSTRRNRRHQGKAELRRQPRVSVEAMADWAAAQVFDDCCFRREAVAVKVTPCICARLGQYSAEMNVYEIWVLVDEYDITIDYEDFDVEEDLVEYGKTFFLTVDEAVNLGLVE